MIATQGSTEGDEVARFRNGFMGDAGVAPVQDDANGEVGRFRDGFFGPSAGDSATKVAGLFDPIKPVGDGVDYRTHKGMKEAGVGPYDGSNAKLAPPAIQNGDSRIDDQIMDAKARDRKNRETEMMETIKKAYPQKEWDRVLKEKLKKEGW